MYSDWLKNLKVGDLVLIEQSGPSQGIGKGTVSEITKSGNIRVGTTIYRKEDGRDRGEWSCLRGSYYWKYLIEYAEKRWQKELERRTRLKYLNFINEHNLRNLPTVTLQAIVTIIESDAAVQEAEKVLDKTAQM